MVKRFSRLFHVVQCRKLNLRFLNGVTGPSTALACPPVVGVKLCDMFTLDTFSDPVSTSFRVTLRFAVVLTETVAEHSQT